jgi:hypothetical protein
MVSPSSITIRYDGVDITTDVLFSSASFEQNTGAVPGAFSFRVKDMNRTHDFSVGKEITLTLDGHKLFGGIVLIVNRLFAFPVVDTGSLAGVQERMWEISGSDYNIWFDKLVVRNPADYLHTIKVPEAMDGDIIRTWFDNYFDLPAGMNITTHVQNIEMMVGNGGYWTFPTQGTKWRDVMEDMRRWSGATYFIDADKNLHWHPVGNIKMSWGLTDMPDRTARTWSPMLSSGVAMPSSLIAMRSSLVEMDCISPGSQTRPPTRGPSMDMSSGLQPRSKKG